MLFSRQNDKILLGVIRMLLEDKSVLESIKKRIWFSFVASILLIIFAVVLLINPDNFIPTAINVFGYVAIFLGILNAVFYFRLPKENRIYSKNLSTSILLILFGIIAFIETSILQEMITIILGGYLIFRNAFRIEMAFNLEDKAKGIWLSSLVISTMNLILGFLIVINPFTNVSINLYLGIMVIVSESLLILENILLLIGFRKYKNHEEVAA